MPMPAARSMRPALRKEMVISDTSELDCMMVVLVMPRKMLFPMLSVDLRNTFSRAPPVKALKPSSRDTMPKRNSARPAAMTLKLGLIQKP
jgi:hypothetical protein